MVTMKTGLLQNLFLALISLTLHHHQVGAASLDTVEKFYDLSYALSNDTIFYPGVKTFELKKDAEGYKNNGSMWYAAYSMCLGEHGGTHLDAPFHFYREGWTVDQIPSSHLVNVPAAVINVKSKVDSLGLGGQNFELSVEDLIDHENQFGQILSRGVVLVYTGWSKLWPDFNKYVGYEKTINELNQPSYTLRFPSVSAEAMKWLSDERQIVGIGLDTPSIDHGNIDPAYPSHVYGAARQIYNLENVANLHLVPPSSTNLRAFILPIKIVGGTGAPVRILVYSTP